MNPLLKWVGSKRIYSNNIINHINSFYNCFNNYYEPFFGGGSIFFKLEFNYPNKNRKCFINDFNEYLMNFYICLKKNSQLLLQEINSIFNENISKEFYDNLRNEYNELILNKKINDENYKYKIASIFFIINKTCFNGVYRVNSKGLLNTPYGTQRKLNVSQKEFQIASDLISKTNISSGSWEKSIKNIKKNDLIFLDPPYYIDESSKFVNYTDPRFGREEHKNMIKTIKIFLQKGAKVVLCNSCSEEFKNMIDEILVNYKYKEIIFTRKTLINPTIDKIRREKFKERFYFFGVDNE